VTKCTEPTDWAIMNDSAVRTMLALFRARNHIWDNNLIIVQKFGLTWAQFVTLSALRQMPPPHQLLPTQLYGAVQVTSGGMTKVLEVLVGRGLLTRVRNPDDARSAFAQLTAKGIELVDTAAQEVGKANAVIIDNTLTPDEHAQLDRLVDKLCQGFDRA